MANLKKIKAIAKEKGILLKEIADALDVTPTYISYMMQTNKASIETIEKICQLLECSADELLNTGCTKSTIAVGKKAVAINGNVTAPVNNEVAAIELLREQLKVKDEQIQGLIEALKNK